MKYALREAIVLLYGFSGYRCQYLTAMSEQHFVSVLLITLLKFNGQQLV